MDGGGKKRTRRGRISRKRLRTPQTRQKLMRTWGKSRDTKLRRYEEDPGERAERQTLAKDDDDEDDDDGIALEGGERGAESRCRRDWKLEEPGRWLRGRLINFFAFFDPHKLCRYTTTEGSPRALKGLASFRASETRERARGEGEGTERIPRRIYVLINIYNERRKKVSACMFHEMSHHELPWLAITLCF